MVHFAQSNNPLRARRGRNSALESGTWPALFCQLSQRIGLEIPQRGAFDFVGLPAPV